MRWVALASPHGHTFTLNCGLMMDNARSTRSRYSRRPTGQTPVTEPATGGKIMLWPASHVSSHTGARTGLRLFGIVAVTVSLVVMAGCRTAPQNPLASDRTPVGTAKSPPFQLQGISLLMPSEAVGKLLGKPDRVEKTAVAADWYHWEYADRGLQLDLTRFGSPPEPLQVVWIRQTKGSLVPGLTVGDPQAEVKARFGKAKQPEGSACPRVQFKNGQDQTLDLVLKNGRAVSAILSVPWDQD